MTSLAFSIPASPTLAVAGSERRFPVGRLFCVGRNYVAHAEEMGMSGREPPFFFTKFPDTVVPSATQVPYPPATGDFQYEGELVVALGRAGHRVAANEAAKLIFGYAAGLDLTRRDLQIAARKSGRPWDTGKNFERSAPVGDIRAFSATGLLERGRLELRVNDAVKQQADLSQMIWSPLEIIAALSEFYVLQPGDLIFTGTPAGVGPVVPGERIDVRIAGLPDLTVRIGAAAGESETPGY